MFRAKTAVPFLALWLLPACVSLTPTLQPTAKPGAAGYVAGFLSRGKGEGFAFRLVEQATGKEYVIPFEGEPRAGDAAAPVAIEVPPGTYRVTSWVTYNVMRERVSQQDVPETHLLSRPFTIAAGQVQILGAFEALTTRVTEKISATRVMNKTYWTVVARRSTEPEVVAAFREAFPGLAQTPASCLVCMTAEERAQAEAEDRRKTRGFQLEQPKLEPPRLRPTLAQ